MIANYLARFRVLLPMPLRGGIVSDTVAELSFPECSICSCRCPVIALLDGEYPYGQ